jgi:beta-lactamase class A
MAKLFYFLKQYSNLLLLLLFFFGTIFFAYSYFSVKSDYQNLTKEIGEFENRFELLSPSIAKLNTDAFLEKQKTSSINYWELKEQILKQIEKAPDSNYGIYFEDLSTGSWIGINEKEQFYPRSLFKVPLMVALLKKVEEGEISLDQKVKISLNDIDNDYTNIGINQVGIEFSVEELLKRMIQESDNTAMRALANNFVTDEDYVRTIGMMGLYNTQEEQSISAREFSNMFRSLYFSTYLRRPFSELALSILVGTKFYSQLPAGLPENVLISHKIGFDYEKGYFHDCGIIYLPSKHYLLCVMSSNTSPENADEMISSISRIVYEYNEKIIEEQE